MLFFNLGLDALSFPELTSVLGMDSFRNNARLSNVPQFEFQNGGENGTNEKTTALPQFPPPPSQTSDESKGQCFPSLSRIDSAPKVNRKNSIVATMVRNLTSSTLGADLGFADHLGQPPSWQPTVLRPFPLVGIGALLIAACSLFASLGILIGSSGKAAEDWAWPPSVFLAIFSAVANRVLQFALVQALPIAWWYKAWSGATIAELQRRWEASEGLFRAIRNARHEWTLALATIFVTLVAIDGVFLQKASSIRSVQQTDPVTLSIALVPELPTGWSGKYDQGVITSDESTPAMVDFLYNTTIPATVTGCQYGACRAIVRGPGVVVQNCSSETWPLTRDTILHNRSATWGPTGNAPLFTTKIRNPSLKPPYAGPEQVELQVGVANYTNCSGAFILKSCTIVAAILEYDVIIQHNRNASTNTIKFAKPTSEARFVAFPNNTFVNASVSPIPLTITALGSFLQGQIHANTTMLPAADERDAADLMPDSSSFNNIAQKYSANGTMCERSFLDPTTDIIADFNNIMFRSGLIAASFSNTSSYIDAGLSLNQTVRGQETRILNVFHSDLRWFAGAAVLELLAILAILPVYFGWWKLGVRVTMSPLEIAKAFEAPMFDQVNSGAGSRGIVRAVGDVKVAFGAAEAHVVDDRLGKEFTRSRLVIADADRVTRPRKAWRFEE